MQVKAETYEQYLDVFEGNLCPVILQNHESLVSNFRLTQKIQRTFRPFSYLVDYTKGKYLFIEETCFDLLGYSVDHMVEIGHRGYYKMIHPDYNGILTKVVFTDFFNFLRELPLEEYSNYVFSFNYRLLNSCGAYVMLMQRHSYIPGNTIGNPAGAVGTIYDITHFRKNADIVCTIEEISGEETKLVYKSQYTIKSCNKDTLLSKREIEVLKTIADGLSTKHIADKLNVSTHTVTNHRKNMLYKTGSKNSIELLRYAINHSLL